MTRTKQHTSWRAPTTTLSLIALWVMRAFSEGTQYITGCQTPFKGFNLQVIHKHNVLPSDRCQTPFEGFYLHVKHKYSVLPSDRCQTPFEGFYLQVKHKYSVPPSERCQTPFEGFYLQVNSVPPSDRCQLLFRDSIYKLYINTVYLFLRDAKFLLRDSINI